MRIIVFTICYNQADLIPFYLRHYGSFVDEISVFDDHSTDESRELLKANPKVILRDWPLDTGIDEDAFLEFAYEWYPKAHPHFDWVIWADIDELVYHENIREELQKALEAGHELIGTRGYNMTGNGVPADDGRQLWEIMSMGVNAPIYDKPIVFRPNANIRWVRGNHQLSGCSPKTSPVRFKLLHYRYLGAKYTKQRNEKNYARCGLRTGDKASAWSCAPGYNGKHAEGSPEWSEFAASVSFNVFTGRSTEEAWRDY